MDWIGTWLPTTVTAAVLLFVVRETLEFRRRRAANKIKSAAWRKALAREIELNLGALESLKAALKGARDKLDEKPPGSIKIIRRPSGRDDWQCFYADGNPSRGGGLRPVRRRDADAAFLVLAEIDPKAFVELERYMEFLAELEHLRGGLIDHADENDRYENHFLGGFVDWALEEIDAIRPDLDGLYELCTGQKLDKGRLR